jgi:hypothetical protein
VNLGSAKLRAHAHLNLVDNSRQLFELDPAPCLEVGDGWLFGAGRSPRPAISNAAFRTDDRFDPKEFLTRAGGFLAALAYASLGFPAGAFDFYEDHAGLLAEAMGYETIYDHRLLMPAPPEAANPA